MCACCVCVRELYDEVERDGSKNKRDECVSEIERVCCPSCAHDYGSRA